MTETDVHVIGGVDTHADTHVAAVIDTVGRTLGIESFPSTPSGHRQLLGWLRGHGEVVAVGVEGTGSYGAGVARYLAADGVRVVEVDRPNRRIRRARGKSDPVDAEAAARAVLAGEATGTPKARTGDVESIRALRVVRRSALKARTQAYAQLHALVITAPDELRERLRTLNSIELVATAARLRVPEQLGTPSAATKLALKELAVRVQQLNAQLERLDDALAPLVTRAAPNLLARPGVGIDVAGALVVAAGDNPERLRSESSFAHLCGAAPIPASSGRVQRHRLNRGGDRTANNALWRIALVRMRCHEPTRAYVERRRQEGLSTREIMRCLKRYIAREIYTELLRTPAPLT
jgi:transposase